MDRLDESNSIEYSFKDFDIAVFFEVLDSVSKKYQIRNYLLCGYISEYVYSLIEKSLIDKKLDNRKVSWLIKLCPPFFTKEPYQILRLNLDSINLIEKVFHNFSYPEICDVLILKNKKTLL